MGEEMKMIEPYNSEALAWTSNVLAIKIGRSIPILDRLSQEDTRDFNERKALAYASGVLDSTLNECRRSVAARCAGWFDGSAFQ